MWLFSRLWTFVYTRRTEKIEITSTGEAGRVTSRTRAALDRRLNVLAEALAGYRRSEAAYVALRERGMLDPQATSELQAVKKKIAALSAG